LYRGVPISLDCRGHASEFLIPETASDEVSLDSWCARCRRGVHQQQQFNGAQNASCDHQAWLVARRFRIRPSSFNSWWMDQCQ